MIIDVHTHMFESFSECFPQVHRDEMYEFKRAVLGVEAFSEWKPAFEQSGRLEALIADMDEAGVDKSVVLPVDLAIMCRQQAQRSIWDINKYVAEAQRKYPDRIIGFVGVDPLRGQEAINLLETGIKEWGLHGVKVIGHFRVTDPEVQAFMSKVNELELPILFHMGTDPLPYIVKYGNPSDLDTLSLWYPKVKIIAAHTARGYEDLLNSIVSFKKEGSFYTDISGLQYELIKSPWHFTLQMRYLMDKVPQSVLMGTDWPFVKKPPIPTHKEWFDAIRNLKIPEQVLQLGLGISDFSQEEKDMILGKNAARLLGIL